jgi:hypothetical protein
MSPHCFRASIQLQSPPYLNDRLSATSSMADRPSQGSRARKYRSKKQRPCDLCRSRKSQCKILDHDETCELCKKLDRECTFVVHPLRKERCTRRLVDDPELQPGIRNQNGLDAGQGVPPLAQNPRPDNGDSNMASDAASSRPYVVSSHNLNSPSNLLPMESSFMDASLGIFETHLHQAQSPRTDWTTDSSMAGANDNSVPSIENVSPSHIHGLVEQSNNELMPATPANEQDLDHFIQTLWASRQESIQAFDWPVEFSLDSRKGYSNQLLGLSGESDPYLLRYYQYDWHDTYPMFRLDFRNIMGDEKLQSRAAAPSIGGPPLPVGYMPVQFVMMDEDICQDDLKSAEATFSGGVTEADDRELLKKLVPVDLGTRLLNL